MRTRQILLGFVFAGAMCSGLLPGTSENAWAWYCGPGDTICIGSWCEPVTTPAARAICPLRRRGGGTPRRSGTRPQTGSKQGGTVNKFPSTTAHQVEPMKCPKAAPYAVAETAYGGTMCASAARLRELQKVFRNLPGAAGQGAPAAAPPSQDLPNAGQGAGLSAGPGAGPGAGQPAAQDTAPDEAAAARREMTALTNELNRLLAVPPDRQTAAQKRRITEILDRLRAMAQVPPQR